MRIVCTWGLPEVTSTTMLKFVNSLCLSWSMVDVAYINHKLPYMFQLVLSSRRASFMPILHSGSSLSLSLLTEKCAHVYVQPSEILKKTPLKCTVVASKQANKQMEKADRVVGPPSRDCAHAPPG